jgi:hypothetical protein
MKAIKRFNRSVHAGPISSLASTFKSTTVFLLLSCLLLDPIVGTFTWLHYKKAIVKKEVQQQIDDGIDTSKLVLLKFTEEETRTQLRWEHSREFEYKNKMYDIVEITTVGDMFYYHCWYDHEETMLNRQMEEIAGQVLGNDPSVLIEPVHTHSSLKSLYCLFSCDQDMPSPELLNKQSSLFSYLFSQISVNPPTPPPQSSLTYNSTVM